MGASTPIPAQSTCRRRCRDRTDDRGWDHPIATDILDRCTAWGNVVVLRAVCHISASQTACPSRGYRRVRTQNDRLSEVVAWCMSAWCMSAWCTVHAVWCMLYGACCMVHALWCVLDARFRSAIVWCRSFFLLGGEMPRGRGGSGGAQCLDEERPLWCLG